MCASGYHVPTTQGSIQSLPVPSTRLAPRRWSQLSPHVCFRPDCVGRVQRPPCCAVAPCSSRQCRSTLDYAAPPCGSLL
eukprot:9002438-Alexandrium_andersonii.AAC.1